MKVVRSEYYVLTNDENPIEPRTYRNYYKRLLAKIGIPDINPPKRGKYEEEKVTFGTIDAFARYCNMKEWNFQFIVIDNKFTENISIEELANINFIDLETRGGLFRQHIKQ